jgi:antitoxin VapB
MDQDERDRVKDAFNDPTHSVRLLIATDAAAEGLNLQSTARYLPHIGTKMAKKRVRSAGDTYASRQRFFHGITPRLTDYTSRATLDAMALNIKNPHVERLAAEVAKLARESKTEAIGRALEERKARLASRVIRRDRRTEFLAFLQREIWPQVPRKYRRRRLTRKEEDALLGYGPEGV